MGRPSIYHDPRGSGLQSEALTESALRILNRAHDVWKGGPHPQCESFNTQNRFAILTVVMQHYNRLVDAFHSTSLQVLCKATHSVVSSGFGNVKQPRIPVHPSLLVEMLAGIYFALYNGHQSVAVQAIKATHTRACYELYSDVLLMTNGLLNSFQHGELPKKHLDKEGLLTPSGSKKALGKGKHSITNASFKAKKLPDDIEFTEEEDSPRLSTVEEDGEHSMAKNLKAKLMTIGGKLGGGGDKSKRRDSDVGSTMSDGSDSVGVAVVKGGHGHSSGKTMVDVVEMKPIRHARRSDSREPGIDQLEDDLESMSNSGGGGGSNSHQSNRKSSTTSSSSKASSLVFSKKLGFTKSASLSPTTGSNNKDVQSSHGHTHSESRKSSTDLKQNSPSLPAIIMETPPVSSSVNGLMLNSNNNSSNNNNNNNNNSSNNTNSSSSSSSGIFSRSGSGRGSNRSSHSNLDTRASSEGRSNLDVVVNNSSSSSSSGKDANKQPKIHGSISDSNLPPASPSAVLQSSSSSSSTPPSANVVTPRSHHGKPSTAVNRNSYSTDL